ncbi:protein-disulfide reductase DsbD domain-containing protein [Yoonia sp. 208BN28-4]|uniref:protein-disulfide reductase DsbD domain-containing protein n=1 Tax=Yoonia sp. 208BN28-4 TaxID=3126505 RepID=UPI0030AB1B75
MKNSLFPALILAFAAQGAQAQSLDGVARLDVIPGWQTGDGTHMAGLRVTLAPGWKTYWRAPGDAGIPPQFSYRGSDNIAAVQYHWPVPDVFHQSGMRSIGYHDSVVLPVEITPAQSGAPIHLSGTIDIGVCEEICIPMQFTFDAALPADGGRDGAIVAALLDQPVPAAAAGIGSARCTITPTERGMQISATIAAPQGNPAVVIEAGDPYIWVSEPDVTRGAGTLTATSEFVHVNQGSFAIDRSAIRMTLLGNGQAIDIQGCIAG